MSAENHNLDSDLIVLEAMAEEMEPYLKSDVLFWQMLKGGLPKLTVSGYLLREHRLLALRGLLADTEQARLDAAVRQFNQALDEKIVRFEQKAHRDLEARIRQWKEYLKDLEWETAATIANYHAAVDTRAMITALVERLEIAPYKLKPRFIRQVSLLDNNLRRHWRPGEFVWFETWRPAYPPTQYWYLYGRPRQLER